MKSLKHLCPTEEMRSLFREFAQECPGAWSIEWSSAAMEEINGKRVLCLAITMEGATQPMFVHYARIPLTEAEVRTLTENHGLDGVTYRDPTTGEWSEA
jgi:hypothetical protein